MFGKYLRTVLTVCVLGIALYLVAIVVLMLAQAMWMSCSLTFGKLWENGKESTQPLKPHLHPHFAATTKSLISKKPLLNTRVDFNNN